MHLLATVVLLSACISAQAAAASFLYVHDSQGHFGTIDVRSGEARVLGTSSRPLTDIAFAPDGRLFGIDATTLYEVDPANGVLSTIGAHGVPGGNALVFGLDGTLFAAGRNSMNLYTVDPATGMNRAIASTRWYAAGDLALQSGRLFLSATGNSLVEVDPESGSAGVIGTIGFPDVFGLAAVGGGPLYGLSRTDLITIDIATGEGSLIAPLTGDTFSMIYGSSFVDEAVVPLPASVVLLATGLGGLALLRRRRRRSTAG